MEGGEQARQMMADASAQLISTRPESLLMQMQGHAAVAASEVQGDDLIGWVPGGEGVVWAAMRQGTPAASSRVVTVGATSPVRLSA